MTQLNIIKTPGIKAIMQRESVRLLYSNSYLGLFITAIASTILALGFAEVSSKQEKIIWLYGMLSLCGIRFIDALRQRKHPAKNAFYDLAIFSVSAWVTAAMWSSYALYFYSEVSLEELSISIIIIAGMAGGAASILAGNKWTSCVYSLVILLPATFVLLISEKHYQHNLGLLGIFFSITILISAYKSARFIENSVYLKHQHDTLLLEMEETVERRTQEIYNLSNIDPLTDLYNRNSFKSGLDRLLTRFQNDSLAIFFVDLDGFKSINDSMGHHVGDQVIRDTAHRIANYCKEAKLICRWGGDEFLIVLEHVGKSTTTEFAERLIKEVSKPHYYQQSLLKVGATIGIATYPNQGENSDDLIRHADMAMYHQKRSQRGKVSYFNGHLHSLLMHEIALREGLANALEKNEFSLLFQPIVDSHTQKISALEALLRWQFHGNTVSPDEFIPVAEQYGFIKQIGLWVIENACQKATVFLAHHPDLSICVNVSVVQFQDDEFVSQVQHILERNTFDPQALHIEITESVFASNKHSLLKRIKQLQALGIKISIDDFGTGYSSLSSMQNLNVDIVKIDKSFVKNMDSGGVSIINAVMSIAHSLGYKVVAEGVETQEQTKELTKMGVHYLQGYYFSYPQPSEQIVPLLQKAYTSHSMSKQS